MKDISYYFFFAAAICVAIGMIWGIQMAASGDHSLFSAHAHLNLVGWVTLALFGIYYRLTPGAAAAPLAKLHLGLAIAGVVVMVPGIAVAVKGGTEAGAVIGSILTLLSMLIFVYTLLRRGFGATA